MNTPWWVYVAIIVGILVLYLGAAFVTYLLMKSAKKKCRNEFDRLVPYERERLDLIVEVRDALIQDERHLPKNLLDSIKADEDCFAKAPADIRTAKGQSDFLIIYLRKYLKEKNLLKQEKYQTFDQRLEKHLWLDPEDKASPYLAYNKRALRYNSYLGMTILAIFGNGKNSAAPIF